MASIPKTTRQIWVKEHGTDFRAVTEIRTVPTPELTPGTVLVKVKYVGINATDINFTAGRYLTDEKPPYPCGLEGIGTVVAVLPGSKLKVGQSVAFLAFGAFAEYFRVEEKAARVVPSSDDPAYISLIISGSTASMAFEKEGDLKPGQTVLVTAAAGGTGSFAVQLAKLAGCHVIGTCSSKAKVEYLKSLGCDRAINYREEKLGDVLKKEYPNGLDVVYECIGGDVFDTALENLKRLGRIIAIGQISKYDSEMFGLPALKEPESKFPIVMTLVAKSCSIRGFVLTDYMEHTHPKHVANLVKLYKEGKLNITSDFGADDPKGPFQGLEKVPDGVDYMYSKKNKGKVVVQI